MTWGPGASARLRPIADFFERFGVRLPLESSFIAAGENPQWRREAMLTIGRQAYTKLLSLAFGTRQSPTLVTDRAWDHLILLDACRHDTLESVLGYPVSYIISPGSATIDWVRANFIHNPRKHAMRDVILITANPYNSQEYFRLQGWPFPFRDCISLWKDPYWDDNFGTVLPDTFLNVLQPLAGGGRTLLHFAQPHFPSAVVKMRTRAPLPLPGDMDSQRVKVAGHKRLDATPFIWSRIKSGEIPLPEAMSLYEENLKAALATVRAICGLLDGRIIITSDHGNLFGEYGLYGHPGGLHVPELVKVPWIEVGHSLTK